MNPGIKIYNRQRKAKGMRSLIDIMDLDTEEIDALIKTALSISNNPSKYSEICRGKTLANLFFEPSTRTRMSIESAMYSLGGNVITMNDDSTSSTAKGESLQDTIKVVSSYVDIIAIRHPNEGAAIVASINSAVPVINAGDGGHSHPTQTLADLLTIYREKKRLNKLTIGFCGDLKYGRTVHSLINAITRYDGINIYLISPEELRLPKYVLESIINSDSNYIETSSLETAMPNLDILYMTRIQKERFKDLSAYERLKDSYILNSDNLINAKKDMSIMHPLPRINEISKEIDDDPRACYFKQVANGKLMRMALILKLLEEKEIGIKKDNLDFINVIKDPSFTCKNPRCITHYERGLNQVYKIIDGKKQCIYCECME